MRAAVLALALGLGVTAAGPPAGQSRRDPRQDLPPRFRVDTFSSLYEVRVIDRLGRSVRGLTEADFRAVAGGRRLPIAYFEERHARLSLGCLVENGDGVEQADLTAGKEMLSELIHLLDPEDEIAIATFDREIDVLQTLTRNRFHLQEAIDTIMMGRRSGFWERVSTAFSKRESLGPAIDFMLLEMRGPLREIKAVLAVVASFDRLYAATGDHLQSADSRLFVVSLNGEEAPVFDVRRRSGGRDAPHWGGVGFSGRTVLERVPFLRDALTRHYLVALEGVPSDSHGGPPFFSLPELPHATVLSVRRLEPGPSVYRP